MGQALPMLYGGIAVLQLLMMLQGSVVLLLEVGYVAGRQVVQSSGREKG